MSILLIHIGAFFTGFIIDLIIGDPYGFPHPVILIGKGISLLEKLLYPSKEEKQTPKRLIFRGLILEIILLTVTVVIVFGILFFAFKLSPWLLFAIESIMTWQILATKSLKTESMKVYYALKRSGASSNKETGADHYDIGYETHRDVENKAVSESQQREECGNCGVSEEKEDGREHQNPEFETKKTAEVEEVDPLKEARFAVSMIVGRDTERLSREGIIKAAVETVAENASDGVIAPMLCLAIGGPIFGFFYKAVNTMDSMLGYKNDRYLYFGRCPAKTDDIMNYIPSRLSALFMICASFFSDEELSGKDAYRIWKRDRRKHASPNSAQTEAVAAGALGVALAGDAYYFGKLHKKQVIGDPTRPVEDEDIVRMNRLLYGTAFLTEGVCLSALASAMAVLTYI